MAGERASGNHAPRRAKASTVAPGTTLASPRPTRIAVSPGWQIRSPQTACWTHPLCPLSTGLSQTLVSGPLYGRPLGPLPDRHHCFRHPPGNNDNCSTVAGHRRRRDFKLARVVYFAGGLGGSDKRSSSSSVDSARDSSLSRQGEDTPTHIERERERERERDSLPALQSHTHRIKNAPC